MRRTRSCWTILSILCSLCVLHGAWMVTVESPMKVPARVQINTAAVSMKKPTSVIKKTTETSGVIGTPPKPQCQCVMLYKCTPQHTLNIPNGAICPPDHVCCSNRHFNATGSASNNRLGTSLRTSLNANGEDDFVILPFELPENCTCVDPADCDERVPQLQAKTVSNCNLREICCPNKFVIKRTDIVYKRDELTTNSVQFPTEPACTCVRFEQCHSLIIPKGVWLCNRDMICCMKSDIKTVGFELQTSTEVGWTTEPSCTCVSPDQCYTLITPRTSCDISHYVCCPQQDLINLSVPQIAPNGPALVPVPTTATQEDPVCGKVNVGISAKIISTETTGFGEFPWMVVILKTVVSTDGTRLVKEFVCGGSLLSAGVVLTSAHCTNKISVSSISIRAGEHNLRGRTEDEAKPHQERKALVLIQHPDFNARTLIFDFALIKVNKLFEYDFHIAPICIPSLRTSELTEAAEWNPNGCVATGWGKPVVNTDASYSHVLKKVELSVVDQNQCQKKLRETYLGRNFTLHSSFICAGGQLGMDTCKGDGGGPLICPLKIDPSRYVQVGITSWGIDCGTRIPAVYASLLDSAIADWLFLEFYKLVS